MKNNNTIFEMNLEKLPDLMKKYLFQAFPINLDNNDELSKEFSLRIKKVSINNKFIVLECDELSKEFSLRIKKVSINNKFIVLECDEFLDGFVLKNIDYLKQSKILTIKCYDSTLKDVKCVLNYKVKFFDYDTSFDMKGSGKVKIKLMFSNFGIINKKENKDNETMIVSD